MKKYLETYKALTIESIGFIGGLMWGYKTSWEYEPVILLSVSAVGIFTFITLKVINVFEVPKTENNHENQNKIIFYDNCEQKDGWLTYKEYNEGKIELVEKSYYGRFSIRKFGAGDPNGVYKIVENKFKVGYKFTGIIYSPEDRGGASADRLAIEDENHNGYGFFVNANGQHIGIEVRTNGLSSVLLVIEKFIIPASRWYQFNFTLLPNGHCELKLLDMSNNVISKVSTSLELKYIEFDRVCIHGGINYFIDDLRIEKI